MTNPDHPPRDNRGSLAGMFWGALVGGLLALFFAPRLRIGHFVGRINQAEDSLRARLSETVLSDPVNEGIAQGKAAARRRLDELGRS